jgi:hypothetical protein
MSEDIVNIIGNGQSAGYFRDDQKGIRLTCNLPPMAIDNVFATIMVDFKMMRAIQDGSVQVPGHWVLGNRPKIHMEQNSSFYLRHASQIRGFYLDVPPYARNATDFNCGHVATHYGVSRWKPKVCNMFGFNSIFDFDMTSSTDFYLESDRGQQNTNRLANNWRGIWPQLFREFPDTEFRLFHKHPNTKMECPQNVTIVTP